MLIHLRPAARHDLPAIATLMNRAYRGIGLHPHETVGWNSEAFFLSGDRTSAQRLAEDLAANTHAHLLLSGDPPEACVWLEPLTPTLWHLGSLTISPHLQNAGRGRQLLTAAEQFAAARGARTIHITVLNVRSTLLAWYQRRGYTPTRETEPFPYNDPRFGTPLRPDLHFVVLTKQLS